MKQYFGIVHLGSSTGGCDVWLRDECITITPSYMLGEFEGKCVKITIEEITETDIDKMLMATIKELIT